MRWLLVGDGCSVHTRRLAAGLASSGIDVHLACFEGAQVEGVTMHGLGDAPPTDELRYLRSVLRLRKIIGSLRPDVVNAHYLSSYGLMTALTGRAGIVQTAWGSDLLVTARHGWRRRAARRALRRAGLVTGCSRSLLDASLELAPGVPVHQFLFGPPAWLIEAPRTGSGIILSARAHEPLYRVDLVLRAWDRLRPRLPAHRLVVAGSGSMNAALRRQAAPDVEFVGAVPHQELLALLLQSDLVLSLPLSDAAGQSVLEAMAARASVVASDVAAMREWLPAQHLVALDAPAEVIATTAEAVIGDRLKLDARWSIEKQIPDLIEAVQRVGNG